MENKGGEGKTLSRALKTLNDPRTPLKESQPTPLKEYQPTPQKESQPTPQKESVTDSF